MNMNLLNCPIYLKGHLDPRTKESASHKNHIKNDSTFNMYRNKLWGYGITQQLK